MKDLLTSRHTPLQKKKKKKPSSAAAVQIMKQTSIYLFHFKIRQLFFPKTRIQKHGCWLGLPLRPPLLKRFVSLQQQGKISVWMWSLVTREHSMQQISKSVPLNYIRRAYYIRRARPFSTRSQSYPRMHVSRVQKKKEKKKKETRKGI